MKPTFNLWIEPWLLDGAYSISSLLQNAHNVRAIREKNIISEVGIFRVLLAIVQDMLPPRNGDDIRAMLQAGTFPVAAIEEFGRWYAHRFDLFSDEPFLQSGDVALSRMPSKVDYVSRLPFDMATGSNTVFPNSNNNLDRDAIFCPACLAASLIVRQTMSPIGGLGYKAGPNGTPPVYVLPQGSNLFESLVMSLVTPEFIPSVCAREDLPWWKREAVIAPKGQWDRIGYTQGLTFTSRMLRLYPDVFHAPCTRCGKRVEIGARYTYFSHGEGLNTGKGDDRKILWRDPFVPHWKGGGPVVPSLTIVGEVQHRVMTGDAKMDRPAILDQLEQINISPSSLFVAGMLTKQAKFRGWGGGVYEIHPEFLHRSGEVRDELERITSVVMMKRPGDMDPVQWGSLHWRDQVEHRLSGATRRYLRTLDGSEIRQELRGLSSLLPVDHSNETALAVSKNIKKNLKEN
jgi:hypothetical protein